MFRVCCFIAVVSGASSVPVRGSIVSGERISIQAYNLDTLKGSTKGKSSGLPGTIFFEANTPEADRWFQSAVIPVGTAWRTPASAKIRLSVRGNEASGHTLQASGRFSVDRVHWSAWVVLPPAADFRYGEATDSARFDGTLTVDGAARNTYCDLMSGAWAKTEPDWTSDENAFCNWLELEQPGFFCDWIPAVGYVQFRFDFLNKSETATQPAATAGQQFSNIVEISGMVFWSVGGLHTAPKKGKEPPGDKKWSFELNASSATNGKGELFVYPHESEIGIAASKEFKDAAGRVTRKDFYSKHHPTVGRDKACALHPYFVRMSEAYEYDAAGNRIKAERRGSKGEFSQTETFAYNSDNKLIGWTTFDGRGTKACERVLVEDQFTTLTFDADGKGIWMIEGVPPKGVDMPYGWGPEVDGLRCGIAPNRTKGQFEDIQVVVSVQNIGRQPRDVLIGGPEMMLKPELWDANGKIVPYDQKRVDERLARLKEMNPGLKPGTWPARYRYSRPWETFILKDWYAKLPAGKYQLTIKRQAPGETHALTSNALELTIE